nr:MAG TPA: hypothetical protein [Caudoviricetes sp.]
MFQAYFKNCFKTLLKQFQKFSTQKQKAAENRKIR